MTDTPRVLTNAHQLIHETFDVSQGQGDSGGGAAWKLAESTRDLDSNLIVLPPGDGISPHTGSNLDVLIFVIAGDGTLLTQSEEPDTLGSSEQTVVLETGAVVWLPRGSVRGFSAGGQGLSYLTVHQRKPGLQIQAGPPGSS